MKLTFGKDILDLVGALHGATVNDLDAYLKYKSALRELCQVLIDRSLLVPTQFKEDAKTLDAIAKRYIDQKPNKKRITPSEIMDKLNMKLAKMLKGKVVYGKTTNTGSLYAMLVNDVKYDSSEKAAIVSGCLVFREPTLYIGTGKQLLLSIKTTEKDQRYIVPGSKFKQVLDKTLKVDGASIIKIFNDNK